ARYDSSARSASAPTTIGGLSLPQMITYYLLVTALSVAITPHPEWDIAQWIRDGKITQFIVRPINYFAYRLAWETSYQLVKTAMFLPALALIVWFFRAYIEVPALDAMRLLCFFCATLLAYLMLSHIKFMLGISAFWIAEVNGFLEIWNLLTSVFSGRLLPLSLLPSWLQSIGAILPFSLLYDFPIQILLGNAPPEVLWWGFLRQMAWLVALSIGVRLMWQRGLLAYEAYGG
ncbi:MAG: viologen exporter family transport system permease protein, partial [Abditibacteriota bacterium]|nr:viologen exporter family transport system permease protein [Abditibacteriota bacterium]